MLKIGQLSLESGVSIKTIRYYEELGLIQSPERTEGKFRLFTPDTVHRLLFVKRLQSLGLSLQEIRECLVIHDHGELPCGDIQEKLIKHIAEIDQQVEQLLLLRQQLTETLQGWRTSYSHSKHLIQDEKCRICVLGDHRWDPRNEIEKAEQYFFSWESERVKRTCLQLI